MAKFQISLNGSNIIDKNRQRKYEDALQDEHQVDCGEGEELQVEGHDTAIQAPQMEQDYIKSNHRGTISGNGSYPDRIESENLTLALEHTYAHQSKTMEIHQQYLSQQAEYLELITAVLNQQSKVLDQRNGSSDAGIIETFQKTLDNFHQIRQQGLRVHQEFLTQQESFSERYLSAVEKGHHTKSGQSVGSDRKKPPQQSAPAEWVVQVPPIILDEKVPQSTEEVKEHNIPAEVINSDNMISTEILSEALLNIVAEKTGYPSEMLELDMDLEADLGIDSIKRVEILGSLEDEFPTLPSADTEILAQTRTLQEIVDYMNKEAGYAESPVKADQVHHEIINIDGDTESKSNKTDPGTIRSDTQFSAKELTGILLEIVAEKTGYPVEMLETDMDMEADLGIDSIKRVEILGSMEEKVPGLPSVETEALAELRTLGQIVDLMSSTETPGSADTEVVVEEKKKVEQQVALENTPVKLITLPAPDQIEMTVPSDRPVIVSDEGSRLTKEVVKRLVSLGWKVLLWRYPEEMTAWEKRKIPAGANLVKQINPGKESIQSLLKTLRTDHGIPAGFIHLHPRPSHEGMFSDQEEGLTKQVFLIAGELKEDLKQADEASRNFYMAVTRIDGFLGLENHQNFQEGSGLTGLVKTLKWEWPEVFCRAIDISPELDPGMAAESILKEIQDPEIVLPEVGISEKGRVTIDRGI